MTEIYAWIFIGLGVWSVMIGAMIVHCWAEDITEADYYALENEQWQRDQDELYLQENGH
jgi:hypothetical protein